MASPAPSKPGARPAGAAPVAPPVAEQAPRRSLAPGRVLHRPPAPLLGLLLLAAVAALAWWAVGSWQAAQPVGPLTASGTIEAGEVLVGAEVAGRLVELAEEGRPVRAGDTLARLDDSLIQLQIRQAEIAERLQLVNQAERYELRAPTDGVVTRVPVHLGEVVAPGSTVVAIANLSQLKLTAYILERDLGQVWVGQQVSVSADPFPGRAFGGVVTSINQRAEFTPRNVQTQRDRLNLVFGVKLRVDNPDGALKPGMPADVTFWPAS